MSFGDVRKVDLSKRLRRPSNNSEMPGLIWVPITDLRIDDAYQRPILTRGWKQIEWIANNFTWASFTPVLVARTADGSFLLIDGQHRSHAAWMAGYDKVPALCVEASQAEQARAFSSVNSRTTQITPHQIFKAALFAGETWAVDCDRIVTEAGCRLMRSNASQQARKPAEVFVVGLIREMVENLEGDAVFAGLKALRQSQPGQDVDLWSQQVLRPWLKAVASNSAYLSVDLTGALDRCVDLFLLEEKAARQAKETREPKARILRELICAALDEFRKSNRPESQEKEKAA